MNEHKYYIGFLQGDHGGYPYDSDTLILQARKDKDYLSCELREYYGQWIITKKELVKRKNQILQAFNDVHGTTYKKVFVS